MSDTEKKAKEVARDALGYAWNTDADTIVSALSRAGLLKDDLDREAREACKHHFESHPHSDSCGRRDACAVVTSIGRRILDAEKPVPKYAPTHLANNIWGIATHGLPLGGLTEAEARAVAKTLNEMEAK